MSSPFAKPARMSEKSWADLYQILRYRALSVNLLTALSAPHAAPGMPERLTRLARAKWLSFTRLQDNEQFFALGTRACRYFGVHYRSGFPFGNDGLLQHVAIATFCAASGFERLLPGEFQKRFPECHRAGLPAHSYCLDREAPDKVAWLLVDHGADAFRFHDKATRVISKRLLLPGFERLFAEKRFRIIVLTATPEKAVRVEKAISERAPLTTPHSVVALPSLSQFFLKV